MLLLQARPAAHRGLAWDQSRRRGRRCGQSLAAGPETISPVHPRT